MDNTQLCKTMYAVLKPTKDSVPGLKTVLRSSILRKM